MQEQREQLTCPLEIQGFSYDDRSGVLPEVLAKLADSGGWVVDRRTTSASTIKLSVEAQLRSIVELYGALIAAGLELTKSSHLLLTDLCTCRRNAADAVDLGKIVTMQLEISFLEDITLHSLLVSGVSPA
jgi:hypothetical protein